MTRTAEETSIVAETQLVPDELRSNSNWRALKVHGPFALSSVGVLASIVTPLAGAGISLFTISTFNTDYVLVRVEQLQASIAALRQAGHTIHEGAA